jgi:cytochrome c-type biogenesis protein CcmH
MGNAIASLQARLAKGGGSADDWELLAKSYEFLGRPEDASKARARQLPALPSGTDEPAVMPGATPVAAAPALSADSPQSLAKARGTAVSGEVSLAASLRAKAAAGATLFIVAKSVDSPGVPVAVFRGSVGTWPVKFTLDDSQSMLPGRNLSSAGRVTIEARISQSGQPLPAAGDLQGSTAAINPADHQPLKILIDRII